MSKVVAKPMRQIILLLCILTISSSFSTACTSTKEASPAQQTFENPTEARQRLYENYAEALDPIAWAERGNRILESFGGDFERSFSDPLTFLITITKGAIAAGYSEAETVANEIATLSAALKAYDMSSTISWTYVAVQLSVQQEDVIGIWHLIELERYDEAIGEMDQVMNCLLRAKSRVRLAPESYRAESKRAAEKIFESALAFFGAERAGLWREASTLTTAPSETIAPTLRPPIELTSIETFTVGSHPWGICSDGTNIWVSIENDDVVAKLSPKDGTVMAIYPAGDGPLGICFDGVNLWIANAGVNMVTKIRASDGTNMGSFSVGVEATHITFDGTNIWVSNKRSDSVTKLRTSDGQVLGTYTSGINHPHDIHYAFGYIWVANWFGNDIAKLDPNTGQNLGNFPVGKHPAKICSDDTNLWVANFDGNTVMKVRPSDGEILGTYSISSHPCGLAYDGANVWIARHGANKVEVLRASDGQSIASYDVGDHPESVLFDGIYIWVANQYDTTVTRIELRE